MKKIMNKRTIIFVLLAALIFSTGVAYAYFTDYEQAKGGAAIYLNGQTIIEEEAKNDQKTVRIYNNGKTDVIARVAIYGDFITETAKVESDWDRDGEFWYYRKILHPGESTSDIVANIDVTAAEAAGHDLEIIVVHESSRVLYDGTEANNVVKPNGWTYPDISVGM